MKTIFKIAACGLLGLALVKSESSAATLALYSFTGAALTPSTFDVNVTAGNVAWGAGLGAGGRGFGAGNTTLYARSTIVDEAISATSTDYIGFTVSANAGYELDLSSISFNYLFTDGTGNPPQNATFSLRSSVDGYAADIASFTTASVDGNTLPTAGNLGSGAIDLSAAGYQNLSTITFRLFLGDDGINNTNYTLRMDELNLQGTASAVPEPSTAFLIFGSIGALLLIRRGKA